MRKLLLLLAAISVVAGTLLLGASAASAAPEASGSTVSTARVVSMPKTPDPVGPEGPAGPTNAPKQDSSVTVNLDGLTKKPSTSVSVIVAMTLLSLLPAILLTCTSFTKILVVLSLTRNALGLQAVPPNQVLTGLALFLSLFIMGPVLSSMNDAGMQPYLKGDATAAQAWKDGAQPLKDFMLKHTDATEIELLNNVAKRPTPKTKADVGMTTLVPAFVLSELKEAFIIGFIIFIPFLVIDLVVSGSLMALGMMMMPPITVSLPFKLLLFVLVDGWDLIIKSIVSSYG